jgi:hypothetical protein
LFLDWQHCSGKINILSSGLVFNWGFLSSLRTMVAPTVGHGPPPGYALPIPINTGGPALAYGSNQMNNNPACWPQQHQPVWGPSSPPRSPNVDPVAVVHQFYEMHVNRLMQKEREMWEFKFREAEARHESRLSALQAEVEFIKRNANRGQERADWQQDSRAANGMRTHGQVHAYRRQGYFPAPDPLKWSVDTPNVNMYIERTAQLDQAKENKSSLAVEGAKVRFVEHNGVNILEAKQKIIAHAVAADLWCSKGAARDITQELGRPKVARGESKVGDVIRQDVGKEKVVLHVVTKQNSPDKLHKAPEPFLRDVKMAFQKLADTIREANLEEIAMTYLCSGLDRLHRLWVMDLLYQELKDVPVTIHFYNKYESKRWQDIGQLFAPLASAAQANNDQHGGPASGSADVTQESGEENQVVNGQDAPLDPKHRGCGPPKRYQM